MRGGGYWQTPQQGVDREGSSWGTSTVWLTQKHGIGLCVGGGGFGDAAVRGVWAPRPPARGDAGPGPLSRQCSPSPAATPSC